MPSATFTPDKMISTNSRRATMLMLMTSMVLFLILHDTLPLSSSGSVPYEQTASRAVKKRASPAVATSSESKQSESKPSKVTKRQLPIYLLEPNKESVSQITWGEVATEWNRTAKYTDLLEIATPAAALPPAKKGTRPVVMIHCGPKSGSTTLRVACRKNLDTTCGIKAEGRIPKGYMNETELYPLIRSCPNTNHFCTKQTAMPMDVPTFDDTTFIHMFPFRTYDEWAASALKQAFDRGRETECNRADKLMDQCKPSAMEIDFRKYGKTDLSKFKELAVPRMNKRGELHIFILYFHRELDNVLSTLSDVYKIPLLPGSDGHGKDKRPVGTCDGSILKKFHECFSFQLMELE